MTELWSLPTPLYPLRGFDANQVLNDNFCAGADMVTKPTTPKNPKAAAKPRGAANLKVVKSDVPGADGAAAKAVVGLRLKDLVDRIAVSTGLKKKDVKTVVEAALIQMGTALKAGENLHLVGLGKLRVVRSAVEGGGAMTLKLRQGGPGEKADKAGDAPLAADDDQD